MNRPEFEGFLRNDSRRLRRGTQTGLSAHRRGCTLPSGAIINEGIGKCNCFFENFSEKWSKTRLKTVNVSKMIGIINFFERCRTAPFRGRRMTFGLAADTFGFLYFNPRTPRGMRPAGGRLAVRYLRFQSTHPHGVRRVCPASQTPFWEWERLSGDSQSRFTRW